MGLDLAVLFGVDLACAQLRIMCKAACVQLMVCTWMQMVKKARAVGLKLCASGWADMSESETMFLVPLVALPVCGTCDGCFLDCAFHALAPICYSVYGAVYRASNLIRRRPLYLLCL